MNNEKRLEVFKEYNSYQIEEIQIGLEMGLDILDISAYINPEYTWLQMREIRKGLEEDLDVSIYADSKYTWEQMREIRKGLEEDLDVSIYADFKYTWEQMESMRCKLLKKRRRNNE